MGWRKFDKHLHQLYKRIYFLLTITSTKCCNFQPNVKIPLKQSNTFLLIIPTGKTPINNFNCHLIPKFVNVF